MGFVLAGIVAPVLGSGAAMGADQGAVQQDELPAAVRDLVQGAVQTLGAGGQEREEFVDPPFDARGGDAVAVGQIAQALVVAQVGEHEGDDGAGRELAPA